MLDKYVVGITCPVTRICLVVVALRTDKNKLMDILPQTSPIQAPIEVLNTVYITSMQAPL